VIPLVLLEIFPPIQLSALHLIWMFSHKVRCQSLTCVASDS
jgi:hypothetical protein